MNKESYTIIDDPGHSWLQVPYNDVIELGIEGKISQYSYRTRKWAFLEEDNDATLFMEEYKKKFGVCKYETLHVNDFDTHLDENYTGVFRFNASTLLY